MSELDFHQSRFDINKVIVVLAGPRTGSSFLYESLKNSGLFLTTDGEDTPCFRKNGLGIFNHPSFSDAMPDSVADQQLNDLGKDILSQVGVRADHSFDIDDYIEKIFWRLQIQWPALKNRLPEPELKKLIGSKINHLPSGFSDWKQVYFSIVESVRDLEPRVDLSFYEPSQKEFRILEPHYEEPPYIFPKPQHRLSADNKHLPLLLKTSTYSYRTAFLKRLFPRAEFKWVCLFRNPAASISALIDGWLSNGFHSHKTTPLHRLNIKGYSEIKHQGQDYWKFDMPPGWQSYSQSHLHEVCAFQWSFSHQIIFDFSQTSRDPVHTVKYEEICKDRLIEIIRFSGADLRMTDFSWIKTPIAAVSEPRPGKWKKRQAELASLFYSRPEILSLARDLGYQNDFLEWT